MLAETFSDLVRRGAARWPDRVAIRWSDRGRTLTYAELDEASDRAAAVLAGYGVVAGDRVGLLAHAGLDYVVASVGAWKLGAISAHISVQVAEQLAQYVTDCTPKVLISTHDVLPHIERDRPAMDSVRAYLCMDPAQPGIDSWPDAMAAAGVPPSVVVDPMDPAHLSYTSGSTGKPKGAVLRHGFTSRAAACIAERLALTGDDASFGATSPASSYGLVANWLPGLHVGMTIGLRGKWDVAAAWDDIDTTGVTYMPGNPILLGDLLHESRRRGRAPSALSLVVSGGAPVPPDLKRAYFDELGIAFSESYGQSELGGFVALAGRARPTDALLGAVGTPLPDKMVAVLDDNGQEVAPGEPGELSLRGGWMWGYWGLPEKTDEATRGGWLHTGDVGTMDADGHVTTLGRWSERISTVGGTVFPRPIEEALQSDARIRYAAVIDAGGPVAVVTLMDPGSGTTADELLTAYRAVEANDQRLTRIELVDPMPMTPTGKLDKITLRTRFPS